MPRKRGQEITEVGNKLLIIDPCEKTTGWNEGATGTDNLAVTSAHVSGQAALTFDKIAGGTIAAIDKNPTDPFSVGKRAQDMQVAIMLYVSALTDVKNLHIDLGTSASHYARFTVADTAMTTGWKEYCVDLVPPTSQTGSGMDTNNIAWVRVGVEFDAAGDTLADIRLDDVSLTYKQTVENVLTGTINIGNEPSVNIQDGAGTDLTSATAGATQPLDVGLRDATGALMEDLATETTVATLATQATLASVLSDTTAILADTTGILADTSSIDGKTPALGQAAKAGSVPVTLASDEDTVNVDVTANSIGLATESTLAAQSAKLPATIGQKAKAASLAVTLASDEDNVNTNLFDGAGTALTSTLVGADQSLDVNITAGAGITADVNLQDGLGNDITSAVAGAKRPLDVTILDSTGAITDAATEATLAAQSAKLPATIGQKAKAASLAVTLASDEDTVNVDVTANSIGLATEATLTGVATQATLASVLSDTTAILADTTAILADTTGILADTSSIDGKTPALGQAAKAGSVPVTLASDEDTLNVDVTANSIGLATESTLAAQSAKLPATIGQKTKAASLAVTLASDEDTVNVDVTANSIGLATEATLATIDADTGNIATDTAVIAADTTSIDGKTPALGQAAKAGSVPVTLASDEDTVNVDVTANSIGLATEATLAAQSAKLPASLGQKTGANSLSIIEASDSGLATQATLATIDTDTGNIATSTGNIDTKLPASVGAKTAAASLSVTQASDHDLGTEATLDELTEATKPTTATVYLRDVWKSGGAAATDSIAISPTAGKKIVLTDIIVSCEAEDVVTLEWDKTGGDEEVTGPLYFGENGGMAMPLHGVIACDEDDADLIVTTANAVNTTVCVVYYEID